jgi:hypothetical protein
LQLAIDAWLLANRGAGGGASGAPVKRRLDGGGYPT